MKTFQDPPSSRRQKSTGAIDDWFAGDFSCCLCFPIDLGINLIGFFTILDGIFVASQIHGITDDGRDDGENAPAFFYLVSYLCWMPFLAGIAAFVKYKKSDSEEIRNYMVKANLSVLIGVIALYCWYLTYFLNAGTTNFMEKDMILLVVLGFASPQILLFAYFDQVLRRFAL